ncbi:hypothetical protein BDW72DRAFT_206435 [Aspergillus terricola var. indicus]
MKRLQAMFNLDNIRLPFAQKKYERGEKWLKGIVLCTWGTGLILVINIILTVIGVGLAFSKPNSRNIEMAVTYEGRCSLVNGWKTGLHLVINILSTGLLAASNYVMQCLCAPSRAAVDRAHSKNRWLDIGTLSLRNFTEMTRRQKTNYNEIVIPSDLAPDEPLVESINEESSFSSTGALENLSLSDCYNRHYSDFGGGIGTIFLVERNYTYSPTSAWINDEALDDIRAYQYQGSRRVTLNRKGTDDRKAWYGVPRHWNYYNWAFQDSDSLGLEVPSDNEAQLRNYLDSSSAWHNRIWAMQLDIRINGSGGLFARSFSGSVEPRAYPSYCLVKLNKANCQLYFHLPICLVVISCNIVKLVCMYMAAKIRQNHILFTLGDALASFLDRPDAMTRGKCLMAWVNPKQKRWYHAVSWRRWTITILFFLTCLAVSWYLYALAAKWARELETIFRTGTNGGFGKPSSRSLFFSNHNITSLIFIANSPQLAVSLLYYLCNSILSCMLMAAEYDDFALERKPLRVSWPRGFQRSTYYLSIPWRYSIPMLVISVILHWLLSQSIFLVLAPDRKPRPTTGVLGNQALGFSLLGILLTLIFMMVAMLALGGLAMRPFRSHMPLARNCSAALAAACHPPDEDTEASLEPVIWGEVVRTERDSGVSDGLPNNLSGESCSEPNVIGRGPRYAHCTFTSKQVIPPSLDSFYR